MFSKTKIVAIVAMSVSVLFFSSCSTQEDVVLNSQQNNLSGSRFHVKHAGFTTLNKSYEQFKADELRIGKAGTPYSEEILRDLYQEKLKSDRTLYDQGYDGYPLQEEVELWYKIKSEKASLSGKISALKAPVTKFVSGIVPHYYEWNATENPSHYNWCGHAALKAVAKYHGALKTLGQIHDRFLVNSSYYRLNKGWCNDNKYCPKMSDLLYATNITNNSSNNYQFPSSGVSTKSTIATFFQQLRDGVDYNKPVIVASVYLVSYGHFYPVVGYKIVYATDGNIDYNASQFYLRDVLSKIALTPLYDRVVSVKEFFNARSSNDVLVVRP